MILNRREALVHLLQTLDDALGADQNPPSRSAGGGSPEHRMSRMYHEGSYRQLEAALAWLKEQPCRYPVGASMLNGRMLWHHVVSWYQAPYMIRYGCPVCMEIAPPEGLIHRHRDGHGHTIKVVSQPIRVYRRASWVREDFASAGVDALLDRMPQFIRVAATEEAA
jgi:hypothetical protein